MGAGVVVLIHLIGIFFLSTVIAVLAGVTVYFLSKEKRKVILAIISPFIGLFTVYFFALIGSFFVSEDKKVDIGFGDTRYVPLSDNYLLLFIGLPEDAWIECSGNTIISGVSRLQQNGNTILGETREGDFFSYNTLNNEFQKFASEGDLKGTDSNERVELNETTNFYWDHRFEVAGSLLMGVIYFHNFRYSKCLIAGRILLGKKGKSLEPDARKFMRRKYTNI